MTPHVAAWLMFGASFLLSVGLTPVVRALALRWGVVDKPTARKVHTGVIPRMGGMAIFIAWLAPLVVLGLFGGEKWHRLFGHHEVVLGVMISAAGMFLLGLYDDFRGATASLKLPFEIAAAIVLYVVGFRIDVISNPFGPPLELGAFAPVVTVLWIVGLTNAINLMDGIDGLAAGVAALTAIVMGFAAREVGSSAGLLYAVPIVGAALGFLVYNFPPASIFMGDCGSLFLGFTLATLSLLSSQKGHVAVAVFVPIIIFAVPITDTSLAMLRRYLSGRQIFEADQRHVHHMLLGHGMSQRGTLFILYGATVVLGGTALLLVNAASHWAPLIIFCVLTSVVLACSRLGYGEFAYARDFLKYGLGHRRRLMFRRELVRLAGECLHDEEDMEAIWHTVRFVAAFLGFDRVSFEPAQAQDSACPQALHLSAHTWQSPQFDDTTRIGDHIQIPVKGPNCVYGTLAFERASDKPSYFGEQADLEDFSKYIADRLAALDQEAHPPEA